MYIISDIHGDVNTFLKLMPKKPFQEKEVVLLGDVGYGFPEFDVDRFNDFLLRNSHISFYIIQGNHDNADCMNTYMHNVWYITTESGAIVHHIDNNSVIMIPGALSYDKNLRVPGLSWWENEQLSEEQLSKVVELAKDCDIILSHDAPLQQYFMFFPETKPSGTNRALDMLLMELIRTQKKTLWLHGHLHENYIDIFDVFTIQGIAEDTATNLSLR